MKLENNKSNIYIGGEFFQQCKKLILHINEIDMYNGVRSIDDITNLKKNTLGDSETIHIPPELEFWGHCSNMQVWVENNYNTDLLHSGLSFPLLKKLTEIGDSKARAIFKEEILYKLEQRSDNVVRFILENQYLDYFTQEELTDIYKYNVSKFESSRLILSFLRAF